jgi:glucose-6-phosphate isomerase
MDIRLDYTNMMASAVGEEHGIRDEELEALRPKAEEIHRHLMKRREGGFLPFYELPFNKKQVDEILPLAEELGERFENVVVLGIGGSALGTLALFRALRPLYHNLMSREERGNRPRLFVLDNVDPAGFGEALALLAPERTVFCVISKSGSTVETGCQFMIAQQWVREAVGDPWREHFILITDPLSGNLRKLAESEGFRSLSIPERVGGRFSLFTPVGLLPLAAAGVDIKAVLAGAADMAERVCREDFLQNPAYLNAALQYLAYGKGLKISVMMPYSDRLRDIADWYRQLWAESLGKKYSLSREIVHAGPTPVKALGTTDQHSQVQLYMEGPFDKVVTFLAPADYGTDTTIPSFPLSPALSYLEGRSLGELIRAEREATAMALTKNGRPNCTITLPAVTPETVGALIYMFEVQTLFAGGLWGIDPLDQPGVEEGKEFTYALMGRPGFDKKKEEFDRSHHGVRRRSL